MPATMLSLRGICAALCRYKQFADAYARLKDEEARNAQAQREAGEREALRRRKIEEESDAEAYKIQRLREVRELCPGTLPQRVFVSDIWVVFARRRTRLDSGWLCAVQEYAEKMRRRGQCGDRSQRPVELRAGDFVLCVYAPTLQVRVSFCGVRRDVAVLRCASHRYYVRHNPVKSRVARIDSYGNVELDSALNAHPDGNMMCTVVSPEGHMYAACALDEMRKVPGQVDDYDTVCCRVADAVRRVASEAVQEAAASEAASE